MTTGPDNQAWARRLRARDTSLHIYLMGIGGAGLAPLACIVQEMGFRVSGSDLHPGPTITALRARGIPVILEQTAQHLQSLASAQRPHVILYSSAVPETNPEWQQAGVLKIPRVSRATFLPALLAGRRVIAVAGTHGKSTTTAMTVHMLQAAGLDAGFVIGAAHPSLPSGRAGTHDIFVIEADEYGGMFLGLQPHIAIATSLDWDHPDWYPTEQDLCAAFAQFFGRVTADGVIIYNRDARHLQRWGDTGRPGTAQSLSFGQTPDADWILHPAADCAGLSTFTLVSARDGTAYQMALSTHGRLNQLNATAAWLAASAAGVCPVQASRYLRTFEPLLRRFQFRGTGSGVDVFDDYAHHPNAVRATLQALRARAPHSRLWAVFQPHTYSRTRALLDSFAQAFDLADQVVIMPTYAAREQPQAGLGGRALAQALHHDRTVYCPSHQDTLDFLVRHTQPGDTVMVMGAGDCWQLSNRLMEHLT